MDGYATIQGQMYIVRCDNTHYLSKQLLQYGYRQETPKADVIYTSEVLF